jgi:colicin import membrane protein
MVRRLKTQEEHEAKIKKIEQDRAALDRRSQAEEARWEKQKEKLETACVGPVIS